MRRLTLLILMLAGKYSFAQMSTADSLFMGTIFSSPVYMASWWFPGNWYVHDSISSKTELFAKLNDEFKFSYTDYKGSYKKMKVDSSLVPLDSINSSMNAWYALNPTYAYQQTNPCFKVNFNLKEISSSAYTTFSPGTASANPNGRTAFLIFPGSGDNATTEMIQGVGYHNLQCQVKDYLQQYGDVYIQIRPLQDIRGFQWNHARLMCEYPDPSQVVNYLASKDKLYGVNVLIESIALTKYLKQAYDRVVILGLSYAGQYCLMNSFETQPDGVLVSGGYTIDVDAIYGSNAVQLPHFGSLFYDLLQRDSAKLKIQQSNSEFLFSWGAGADPINETVGHVTENYFTGLTNTQYYYNYTSHTFPSCPAYNNLLDSINKKAKPIIKVLSATCNPSIANLNIVLKGKKPYTFDLYRNDTLFSSHTCPTDSLFLSVNTMGTYQIRNLIDSLGVEGFMSDEYDFIPNEDIAIEQVSNEFICDSNQHLCKFKLVGMPHWAITYSQDGVMNTIQNLYADSLIQSWSPATYVIHTIQDDGACLKVINDTIVIPSVLSFNDVFHSAAYSCDSNKMKLDLDRAYEKCIKIKFTRNGIADSLVPANGTIFLNNGSYIFNQMQFVNGCSKLLSFNYTVNESPVNLSEISTKFNCDSAQTEIKLKLFGKSPWEIFYHSNSIPHSMTFLTDTATLSVSNGNYLIHTLMDHNSCLMNPLLLKIIDDTLPSCSITQQMFNCDSNKTQFTVSLEGRSPWTFYYTNNGIPDSLQITNKISTLLFGNGDYTFSKIKDWNGCEYTIDLSYVLNDSLPEFQFISTQYDCALNATAFSFDLSGKSPFMLSYFKNGNPIVQTFSLNASSMNVSNGNYFLSQLKDANNCIFMINQQHLIQHDSLQVTVSSPVYNCTSNTMDITYHFNGNPPFAIHYVKNGQPDTLTVIGPDAIQQCDNGVYFFTDVTDVTGCLFALSDSYTFNNDTLELSMGTPAYSCDSNKTKVHFELEGNPPFTIYYFRGLTNHQIVTNQTSFDAYFPDGNYFFYKVSDSYNCIKDTTLFYTFNYQPLSGTITAQAYSCDSNKYRLDFLFAGDAPWHLEYTDGTSVFIQTSLQPTMSVFLNNGNWVINKVTNDVGCVEYFNLPLSLSFNQLSASIVNQSYDCDSNKLRVNFSLAGNFPWIIQYVKNGVVPIYLYDTTSSPNYAMYLPNGSYAFLNVKDNTDCNITTLFQTAYNNYTPLTAQQIGQSYICDSNKVRVDYVFAGDAPFSLTYINTSTGISSSVTTSNTSLSLFFSNGNYAVLSVSDSKCVISIQDTVIVNVDVLSATMAPIAISCDSSMYTVPLIAHGGYKPYTYQYYFNGNPMSLSSYTDTTVLVLPNGNYHFTHIVDSTGCTVQLNTYLTVAYTDFQFNTLSSDYLCDADSTQITFDITHQQTLWMVYTLNGIFDTLQIGSSGAFNFGNGSYDFLMLYDSVGCQHAVNEQLMVSNVPIAYSPFLLSKDCNTKSYAYTSALSGKAPWQLIYNINNFPDTLVIPSSIFQWPVSPGAYNLLMLKDSNGCAIAIGESDTLESFLSQTPILQMTGGQFFVQPAGFYYYWYKNNVLVDSSFVNTWTPTGDGLYYVTVKDQAGCFYSSNSIQVNYPTAVTEYATSSAILAYPNPLTSLTTIQINEGFGSYWTYVLTDMQGNKVLSGTEKNHKKIFDLSYLPAGLYSLVIMYEKGEGKQFIRLIKK